MVSTLKATGTSRTTATSHSSDEFVLESRELQGSSSQTQLVDRTLGQRLGHSTEPGNFAASDEEIETTLFAQCKHTAPVDAVNAKVLEYFSGKVDRVQDGVAFVWLTSVHGEQFRGRYSAGELAALGIQEGDRFDCETIDDGKTVSVRVSKPRRIPMTDDQLRRMDEQLNKDFDGLV